MSLVQAEREPLPFLGDRGISSIFSTHDTPGFLREWGGDTETSSTVQGIEIMAEGSHQQEMQRRYQEIVSDFDQVDQKLIQKVR